MIYFNPTDYGDLDTFKLSWRWTNPKYTVLPEDEYRAIRPLRPHIAEQLYARYYVSEATDLWRCLWSRDPMYKTKFFSEVERIITIDQIKMSEDEYETDIVIIWDPDVAAVVPWKMIQKYWDDFWYDDDLYVFPTSQRWGVFRYHEDSEPILFGKKMSM